MGLVRGAVRHYCLGGCSALVVCARRSRPVWGGWGRCRVLRLPRFSLPAPRFLRCVWRAIASGCPLSSLAGTPFHAVSAFRGLGPVPLLVFPACPLGVCALALLRRPPPPLPGSVWRAHLARSRCWPLVGPFHAVRAPLLVLPRSRAPFGLLGGGAARSSFPLPCLGLRAPRGVGAGVGTRHQPHRAPSCEAGRRDGARGGRLLTGCGASRVGRSPTPNHSSFRACSRVPLPTGCGCGGCGRGNPSPTPPRALLRAGFAHCGGGMRVPEGGGAPLPRGPGLRSPTTDRPSFGACGRGPLPTGCGCGGCRRGDPSPTLQRALLRAGFARCGGGTRAPQGGVPLAWVWGVRGRALSHPGPPVLWGVRPWPTTHWRWMRGVLARGPATNPTARAPACWLGALWGQHKGARGGRLLPGFAALGSGALTPPNTRPFGRAAEVHYPLAVGAAGAGVGTRHQPRSARSCELALRLVGAA